MILRRALGWFGDKFIIFTKLEEEISRLEKKENLNKISLSKTTKRNKCIKIVRRNKINVLIMLACV